MACPYMNVSDEDVVRMIGALNFNKTDRESEIDEHDEKLRDYNSYLQVPRLLSCQGEAKGKVHDEFLFIITHQAYELWFRQILVEVDSVRELFMSIPLEESKMLIIINRLNRINLILKLLCEQFGILETMTPHDFLEFRTTLGTASGFQSLQFRLIEIKFGLKESNRIQYNRQNYIESFNSTPIFLDKLKTVLKETSLHDLLMYWLERTPGLEVEFNFWEKYRVSAYMWIHEEFFIPSKEETDPYMKRVKTEEHKKQKDTFDSIFDEKRYEADYGRGDRRFSYKAFQGALMISCYRDEPRFHQPYQMLKLLLDIDSNLTKWRYNHVMMVQRMIGSKIGTGGSSGYQYLRSTISDRYKIFLDVFNLSTYLIPRHYIPVLDDCMKRKLSNIDDIIRKRSD